MAEDTGRGWILPVAVVAVVLLARVSWQRLTVDAAGITIHRAPGRRHLPWHELRRVEVDWRRWDDGARLGRATQPALACRDGRTVRSSVLHDLARPHRDDERQLIHRELARHAERHQVGLDVLLPGDATDPGDEDDPADPNDPGDPGDPGDAGGQPG